MGTSVTIVVLIIMIRQLENDVLTIMLEAVTVTEQWHLL